MGRSLLNVLDAFGGGDRLAGVQVVADLRQIPLETELKYITGELADPDAASARQSSGFFEQPGVVKAISTVGKAVTGAFSFGLIPAAITAVEKSQLPSTPPSPQQKLQALTGGNMGFFDDVFDSGTSIFDAQQIDYSGLFNQAAGAGISYLNSLTRSQSVPSNLAVVPGGAVGAMVPAVMGAARVGMTALARKLASIGLTRSAALSQLRRFGPSALIALGLTAFEVSQVASMKSRRMNMCNGRALRRAQRRLSAFHSFYKRTCGLPSVRHRRKSCK